MLINEAKQRATPFIKSLDITPYTPEFCEMRDDLAELIQEIHTEGVKHGKEGMAQKVNEVIELYLPV